MEPMKKATIHCELVTKINFACHQSSFALLRDLRIENVSFDQPLNHLNVTLTSDPGFLKPKSWCIDRILPGGRFPEMRRQNRQPPFGMLEPH